MTNQVYYTVYQTTNLVNGKIYVGVHKTKDPNDGYMGSGIYLKESIEKNGLSNFRKDVIFIFDNEKDMYAKEAEIVNENFVARNDTYNIRVGGYGGWEHIDHHEKMKEIWKDPNYQKQNAEAARKRWNDSTIHEKYRKTIDNSEYRKKLSKATKEALNDPEVRKRNSESKKGKIWIYSETKDVQTKIPKEDTVPEGFVLGQRPNKTFWVFSEAQGIEKLMNENDPVPNGFCKGRLPRNKRLN